MTRKKAITSQSCPDCLMKGTVSYMGKNRSFYIVKCKRCKGTGMVLTYSAEEADAVGTEYWERRQKQSE